MRLLAPGPWSRELVIHKVKSEDELDLTHAQGVEIMRLATIIKDMRKTGPMKSACGADLLELVELGSKTR